MHQPAFAWYAGTASLLVMSLFVLIPQADVEAWRSLIRLTARTSLVVFLLAYTASALYQRWPSAVTAWLRARRQQWGLLLLTSHGIHLCGIVAFWWLAPDVFTQLVPVVNLYTGGLAYVFLIAMGLTSHPLIRRWVGQPMWNNLHTWGMHYLLLSFLMANGKRISLGNAYAIPVVALLLAVGLRVVARRQPVSPHPLH